MQEKIKELCNKFGIADLYVFGSRAQEIASRIRGESGECQFPLSDVDIGIRPRKGIILTLEEQVKLAIELEDLLGVARVDLLNLVEVDPFLALDIIRGELLYSEDSDKQAEHELYILRRAGDLVYFKKQQIRQILKPS